MQSTNTQAQSAFTVLEILDNGKALVSGPYDTTEMRVGAAHACGGQLLHVGDVYSDRTYCSGCNFSNYRSLGE